MTAGPHESVLVTGASGFLGGALCRRLLAQGRSVRALSRSAMPDLEKLGAETFRADILDTEAVRRACQGVGTVFHAAARVGIWGPRAEFERTNINGTRSVIEACGAHKVRRIVFTSSPSVVFGDSHLSHADESVPLATNFPADYPRTKAEAERIALAAHGDNGLCVTALRPHLVFGEGDENLLPRVVRRAMTGRLRIVGDGKNKVDLTHIDNVVDAHLLAEAALRREDSPAGGRAYFISNGEPVLLWPWINDLLQRLDIPPVQRRISLPAAKAVGAGCELVWTILRRSSDPPMTRFVAAELARDHWFNIEAARRDLGYQPRVSMDEGLARTLPWLRKHLGLG